MILQSIRVRGFFVFVLFLLLLSQVLLATDLDKSEMGVSYSSCVGEIKSSSELRTLSLKEMNALFGGWTSYSECTRGMWHEYGCTTRGCYYDPEYGQNCIRTELEYYHCGPSQTKDCIRMNEQTCAFKKLHVGYLACFDEKRTIYVQVLGCTHRAHQGGT